MSDRDLKNIVPIKRQAMRQSRDRQKFKKLRSLACFDDVVEMLRVGYKTTQVAEFIQEECKEYTEIKPSSLSKILGNFRDEEIPAAHKAAELLPSNANEILEDLQDNVDVLKELNELYLMQKGRIETSLKTEREFGVIRKPLGQEITRAVDILGKIKEAQQEFGMTPRHLGTMRHNVGLVAAVDDEVDGASEFLASPMQRNQVLEFMKMIQTTDPRLLKTRLKGELSSDGDDIEDADIEEIDE